jgi:hypothetical protein
MLVAKREPLSHSRAAEPQAPLRAYGVARFMTVLQLAGSLLAIPIGLASGYTIYRANFSPGATCQTLRSNILATLDRGVDAATRRMLVHRDVEAFERSCGAVDPEAVAAFKRLLVTDKTATVVAVTPRPEARPKEAARKPEPQPVAAAVPERRDASDAAWVAAVRKALVAKNAGQIQRGVASARPTAGANGPMPLDLQAASLAPTASPQASAPAMPVTSVREPDHPVPPGLIPTAAPTAVEPIAGSRAGSHGGWVARIPFVGEMIAGRPR